MRNDDRRHRKRCAGRHLLCSHHACRLERVDSQPRSSATRPGETLAAAAAATRIMNDTATTTTLVESLSEFTQAFENEDYAKVIQLALALLLLAAASTQDAESISAAIYECYIKALIQEEKFEDVLELWNPNNNINNANKKQPGNKKSSKHNSIQPLAVPSSLEHLRIYALYRLQRFEKSRELAAAATATAGRKQPDDTDGEGSNDSTRQTLMLSLQKHLLAQSLFHLQQNAPAMDLYQQMLKEQTADDAKKEQQQILTNIAAVASSNATPYVRNSDLLEKLRCVMQEALLEKLGGGQSADKEDDDDDDDDLSAAADLAYNLATYELLTSPTEIHKWQQVLRKAASLCSGDDEKEAALMKSNLDWSSLFWSGNVATDAPSSVPMNQLSSSAKLVALTNRALSMVNDNDPSKTAANALRLVPPTENLIHALTPLQMRLVTYNRALLQYRAGLYNDCRASCQLVLDSASAKTSKKKRATTTENNASGAAAGSNSSSSSSMIAQPTLDAADAAWWESRIVVLQTLCHKAECATAAEPAAANKGDKNGSGSNNGQKDKSDNLLQTTLEKISKLPASPVRDSAVMYLQLQQAALVEQEQQQKNTTFHSSHDTTTNTIALLKSLPESMQKRRAVVATLASLHQQQQQQQLKNQHQPSEQVQQLLEEMGDDSAYADFLMGQQQYQQAADLYQKAAAAVLLNNKDDDKDYLTAQARYIQALSFVDPQKAQKLWLQIRPKVNLDNADMGSSFNGAELEMRELPRLKSSHATRTTAADPAASAASVLPKTAMTMAEDGKPKKSREAVLRQRARKREAYVGQLEKKGLRHVANPDPERWLPKYERSYNRRRRHRNQQQQQQQHKGAQGGISEKDAAKLDVAARQAARNDPTAAANGATTTATSTAQTAVSTGAGPRKGGRRR
jgi:signal recognition particle subunit SRP72